MPQAEVSGYEIIKRIGAGAQSGIYKARERRTGRIVAIKHVAISDVQDRKYLRHMQNEYHVLRELQHGSNHNPPPSGFVRVFRLIKSGRLWRTKEQALVMQYIEGRDLRRERRYPLGQILDFTCQLIEVLSYIHQRGFVHGDLKPENMIVGPMGRLMLVDFGFSCRIGTRAARVRGTRQYMAPEQAAKGLITERTDIYNLGASVYYLFSGRYLPALVPDQDDDAHFIHARRLDPTPLDELNPNVPAGLARLVMRCCARDPADRPGSMDEVAASLALLWAVFQPGAV